MNRPIAETTSAFVRLGGALFRARPLGAARALALGFLLLAQATCRLLDLVRPPSESVIAIVLEGDTVALADTVRLTPEVRVDAEVRSIPLTWTSLNPTVADVDSTGLVRGLARGKAAIQVSTAPGAAAVPVNQTDTVWVIAASLELAPSDTMLTRVNDTLCLRPTARDAKRNVIAGATPTLRIVADPDSTIRLTAGGPCVIARRDGAPATMEAGLDTSTATASVTVETPEDPAAPTELAQLKSDGTPITVGADLLETTVLFRARVSDPDPGDRLRLEVELKRVEMSFDGTGTVVSPAVSSGAVASSTVSGIPDDANYHWRARVRDQTGRAGPWVSFGGNAESSADFHIPSVAEPPDAPTDVEQFQSDGLTAIAPGGTAFQSTVVFKARLTDADPGDRLKLEVEVQPLNTPFSNLATGTSTAITSGAMASVTVSGLTEDGQYHWQARTTDQTMRASPWTSFGGNGEAAADFHVAVPDPPNAPTGLGQFKGDGIAELTLGTTTAERTVVFKGTVTDPDPGDQIRLEIETKPLSTTFDSLNTTLGTAVASGSQASVTVANQGDDQSYHWRARAVDQSGRTSAWVNFGPNLESEADYRIVVPEPPGIDPASLAQFEANGTTTIATGATTVENTVVLRATLTDPDPGDQVLLDVELRPATQAFTGIPTHSGSLGPAGSVQITAADLPDDIDYHWRARARDQADSASAWMSFGGNPEGARDFRVAVPQDPNPPAELRQLKSGGADSIPVGDTARTNAIVFRTRLTDPDQGDQLRLEVEWKLVGSPFNEMDTDTSAAVASGDTVTLAASGLLDDEAYHWRVRALDQLGRRSAWASYGGNADGAVDFRVAVPQDPAAPTSLQQFESDGTTAIPPAGTTADATVVFKATVSDPDPGDQLRLQVEVQPVGTDFTNSPSATDSTAVGDGNVASVSFGPLGNATDYHWRVRAIDQTGRPGPWAALATPEKDFRVDIPGAPGLPTSLQQFRGDSTTVIPQAAIIGSTTVVLKATVSDAENDMVRLEVEVKPTRAFTGSNTVRGELVASGSVAAVRVSNLDDDSDYHWRARAVDATGLASGWVEFGTTERDFRVQVPERPALDAASLAQFKIDATTPIGIGGTTDQNTVVLKATLTDPDPGDQVLLDLEVRPVTEDFTGTPTHSGNLGPAGSAQIAVTDRLDNTSYHWRARARDQSDSASAWVSFGGNADGAVDFQVAVPEPPGQPTALGQFRSDGSTPVAVGETVTQSTTVVFKATLGADPDPGDQVRLDLEVRSTGQTFTGTPTHSSALGSAGAVQFTATGLTDDINYHWRARTRDQSDSASGWVSFGDNADSPLPAATDFAVAVPQDPSVPSELKQLKSFGSANIVVGDTTKSDSIVFRARLTEPDAGDQVRFQVEWKPVGTAFDSLGTRMSAAVGSGDTAVVAVTGLADTALADNTAYHWRVKAWDQTNRQSDWVSFGGNTDPNDVDFRVWIPENPLAPSGLDQFKSNATTPIAGGSYTNETTVVFKATPSDPDPNDSLRLEIEVRPVGTPFSNTATLTSSPVLTGQLASDTLGLQSDNTAYHWQVRTTDKTGRKSQWVSFGANAESEADYAVNVANDVPSGSQVNQYRSDNTVIPVGGSAGSTTVVFQAILNDVDPLDQLRLEVEWAGTLLPYTGAWTASSTVTPGGTATITATISAGDYHWRYRVCDQTNSCTTPTGFGDNFDPDLPTVIAPAATDFTTP